jgi:hypothetical protein
MKATIGTILVGSLSAVAATECQAGEYLSPGLSAFVADDLKTDASRTSSLRRF